jgi:hypothetical protein
MKVSIRLFEIKVKQWLALHRVKPYESNERASGDTAPTRCNSSRAPFLQVTQSADDQNQKRPAMVRVERQNKTGSVVTGELRRR